MRKRKTKDYKIYGRDKGNPKAKERYLFTMRANNSHEAVRQARNRIKGAYTITRVIRV